MCGGYGAQSPGSGAGFPCTTLCLASVPGMSAILLLVYNDAEKNSMAQLWTSEQCRIDSGRDFGYAFYGARELRAEIGVS